MHIFRSELLRRGATLSQATQALAKSLGVEQKVVPMSDDVVSTIDLHPGRGRCTFRTSGWTSRESRRFRGIAFSRHGSGSCQARPSWSFWTKEDTVLIGPSNPVTSIGPILALPGVRERLADKRVIAMSPLLGDKPASGPAAKFMSALGAPAGDEGVRTLLGKVDLFVVDKKSSYRGECRRMSTRMKTRAESRKVAEELLAMMEEIFHQDRTHC
ncbi:MAG: 2-phospho-L-lactate transferase CofD family protein [Marinilabiliales bacterium]|nr:2-phospho-L-lactate transferase CofD family protein [Marinilabiliales bacterium]